MTIITNKVKIPVVTQYREILTGEHKGKIRKVAVYCKYIDDVVEYKRKYVLINGPNVPCYRVLKATLQILETTKIDKTYEEEIR